MVADYNGWTDLPEAEREALDELESRTPVSPDHRQRRKQLLRAAAQEMERGLQPW